MGRSSVVLFLNATIKQPARQGGPKVEVHRPRTRKQTIEDFKGILDERLASFRLTKRETMVARMILRGKTHESMAKEARVATPTIRFHVANIYEKAGCTSKSGFFDRVFKGIL